MSITAAGANFDAIVQDGPGKTMFESGKAVVSSASNWNQGDLVYLDTTNHILNRVSSTAHAISIQGVADNVVTSGKLAGPYDGLTAVDAAQVTPDFAGSRYGVVASMKLVSGQAYNVGAKVYLWDSGLVSSVDSQTVYPSGGDTNTSAFMSDRPSLRRGQAFAETSD